MEVIMYYFEKIAMNFALKDIAIIAEKVEFKLYQLFIIMVIIENMIFMLKITINLQIKVRLNMLMINMSFANYLANFKTLNQIKKDFALIIIVIIIILLFLTRIIHQFNFLILSN